MTGRDGWRPQLVALDIDGTLVDVDQLMSPTVWSAVERARRGGAHIVVATGRAMPGAIPVVEQLELPSGYVVCSNGAVTASYHPPRVEQAVTFDARPVVDLLLEHLPAALVAVEVVGHGYRVNREFPAGEITGEIAVQPVDRLLADPVTRVIIRQPTASAEEFIELAERLGLHGVNYFVGYTAWLDLAPDGVSKASALGELAERLGVGRSDVLAIGDGRNDVEMLTWAGRGVAMGDAPAEVQDAADDVTETIAADGVARELGRWFG